jgi:Uma2 family endonuclease
MRTPTNAVTLFETKPNTEWLCGRPVQKVSPRYAHGLFQSLIAAALGTWANGRGRVASEWRFWVTPEGEEARYLVPDVAFLSYERLRREAREEAEEPHVAPDAVFEVRSKDDRNLYVEHKVAVYLRSGTKLVCIVDPYARRLIAHDPEEMRILGEGEMFSHPALPDFRLSLPDLFAKLDE